jgi:A/G-specific adenine glycosylase
MARKPLKKSPATPKSKPKSNHSHDLASLIQPLIRWYPTVARVLPWRDAPPGQRDPYRTLVSEIMLQQTQVSRVAEKFPQFLARFPTVHALAAATEDEVLAAWKGMGYYRRAKLLHAAAKALVEVFAGSMPTDEKLIRSLPAIGPYTAGAIRSIALGQPAPIVDGNVVRILLRVHGRHGAADHKPTLAWCWKTATELAHLANSRAGLFNEAMMELGATTCTPKQPRCNDCPWSTFCIARRDSLQDHIPRPKTPTPRKTLYHTTLLLRNAAGQLLLEQRPARGLWSSMWQAPTLESSSSSSPDSARSHLFEDSPQLPLTKSSTYAVQTTHRDIHVTVYTAARLPKHDTLLTIPKTHNAQCRRWVHPAELDSLALSNAQRSLLTQATS